MAAETSLRAVHSTPGRIRFEVPKLRRRPQLVSQLEHALGGVPGIRLARGSARTGTLLILYEPDRPSGWEATLAQLLGSVPGHTEQLPTEKTAPTRPGRSHPRGAKREHAPHGAVERTAEPEAVPVWHTLSAAEAIRAVQSAPDGLAHDEAADRLEREGPNAIAALPQRGELRILGDQLASAPVAMLGVSSALSAAMGAFGDAAAIASVVGINATVGFFTERGAERTIAALTQVTQQTVSVLRDGSAQEISVEEIVRGDVLVLKAGVFLAADARLLDASDLTVDESSLTGESIPVSKSERDECKPETPLSERTNMVYRGTVITGGSGTAVVIATGARTELGHIQELAGNVTQGSTPMQRQLDQLGKQLAIGAGAACLGMLGIGLLRGMPLLTLLRTGISLGVAAVPEGLPTVAMSTLALGLSRLRDEKVLVRKLAAVETLGATQVVCLDKTGTLTINRMTVVAVEASLRTLETDAGRFRDEEGELAADDRDLRALLQVAVLCNEVELVHEGSGVALRGSATESALVQVALAAGVNVEALRARWPVRSVQRRAQARNYMSTQHSSERDGTRWMVKGRPSEVLALCTHVLREGKREALSEAQRRKIELHNEHMAGRGLRVLGFARGKAEDGAHVDELPGELCWVGLMGMSDPPREGVPELLARLRGAGVKTIMITGDQSATAHAVGRQIGLAGGERLEIIDSTRLDTIPPEVLGTLAQRADIFSRVSPAHKLHIVRALQRASLVVAMTGDGINDGPALKAADIGVAMGAGGSIVAREMADVVLENDDLDTLITAITQGRTIYQDIRKAVRFILTTNLSELLFTITAVASGVAEPLTPLQLLWINLMTDIFPELALAVQPPESDVLKVPPRDPERPMFTAQDLRHAALEGGVITAAVMANYFTSVRRSGVGPRASTLAFTSLMFAQLMHGFSARSETHRVFDGEPVASNKWLPISIGGIALVQLLASAVSPVRTMLGIVPLRASDWAKVAAAAVGPFAINEMMKTAFPSDGRSRTRVRFSTANGR